MTDERRLTLHEEKRLARYEYAAGLVADLAWPIVLVALSTWFYVEGWTTGLFAMIAFVLSEEMGRRRQRRRNQQRQRHHRRQNG